jgi:hypothetical protein
MRGNVGIGTTSPSYPLQVNGNVYVNGTITSTDSITSTKSGTVLCCKVWTHNINGVNKQFTTFSGTSQSTFAWVYYTPVSSSSYIIIECDFYYFVDGYSNDNVFVRLHTNTSNVTNYTSFISLKEQVWMNGAGGGTRSSVLFPIYGAYSNSSTTPRYFYISISAGSLNDIMYFSNNNNDFIKITEIAQ